MSSNKYKPPSSMGLTVPGSPGPTEDPNYEEGIFKTLLWALICFYLSWIIGRVPQLGIYQTPLMLVLGERLVLLIFELRPGSRKDRLLLRLVYWGVSMLYLVPSLYPR